MLKRDGGNIRRTLGVADEEKSDGIGTGAISTQFVENMPNGERDFEK